MGGGAAHHSLAAALELSSTCLPMHLVYVLLEAPSFAPNKDLQPTALAELCFVRRQGHRALAPLPNATLPSPTLLGRTTGQ